MTGTALSRRASLRVPIRVAALPAARVGSLVVLLAVWEILGRAAPIFASYPTAVVAAFVETTFVQGRLLPAFLVTFQALATGFAIAAVLGVLIGYCMARSRLTRTLLGPYVAALYSTPRITRSCSSGSGSSSAS